MSVRAQGDAAQVVQPASTTGLNKFSARITQPKSQGASQAMLYATGLKEADMNKPQARVLTAPKTQSAHPSDAAAADSRCRAGGHQQRVVRG